jgi:hypothetical protein
MVKIAMRLAFLVMLWVPVAAGDAAAKRPNTKTSAGVAVVAGKLEFAVVDDTVRLTARGSGWSSPWGDVVAAEATWSPSVDRIMALLAGQIDELTINTGTFAVEFANAGTVGGTIAGTVRPRDDGAFGLELKFIATHGTGQFAGVSGGGTLRAIEDVESFEFRAMLHAKLSVAN